MTNVKGCLGDPFVHAIYGHTHRNNIVEKYGYKDNTCGFILGIDDVWTFANEKYFRLGVALGYVHGKTKPFGSLSSTNRVSAGDNMDKLIDELDIDFGRDVCAVRLFGAYESFDDKCLKTNIGVILGYNYGRDNLHADFSILTKEDPMFDTKFISSGFSLGLELIKNLYAYRGYQFGLWFQANYAHVSQYIAVGIPDSFLATVIGFNMEKESFKHADRKFTLSLKAGWEYRIVESFNSNAVSVLTFMNRLNGPYITSRHPVRNTAVISFRASQKLNDHWSIVGSYVARFSRDFLAHSLACGIEYSF
ncbi:MAG: autotransporter outer membrane beta-barrel domain-containing protein [Puniceicoccales bacterium]|nr:autotransporter outer membrane beta-barrel domain-containing protein [Puniceicoccales bacterium]